LVLLLLLLLRVEQRMQTVQLLGQAQLLLQEQRLGKCS
jgi:hypothetical protein